MGRPKKGQMKGILFPYNEKRITSLQGTSKANLSLVERLHCIRDKGPVPNLSLVERLHFIKDKRPVPNLLLVERYPCPLLRGSTG